MAGQKPAILRCYAVYLCLAAEFVVGFTEDGLMENVADALLFWAQTTDIFVAGMQWHLRGNFEPRNHYVDASLVQLGEAYSAVEHI